MSRLFYEREKSTRSNGGEKAKAIGHNESETGVRAYLEKVAKLIPGEVLAAYLTMIGLATGINDISENTQNIILWCIFSIGAVFTPIYLNYMADQDKPKAVHLILSTVAFVVWAYQVTGDKLPIWYNANVASIALILFTLISGVIPLKKN